MKYQGVLKYTYCKAEKKKTLLKNKSCFYEQHSMEMSIFQKEIDF